MAPYAAGSQAEGPPEGAVERARSQPPVSPFRLCDFFFFFLQSLRTRRRRSYAERHRAAAVLRAPQK